MSRFREPSEELPESTAVDEIKYKYIFPDTQGAWLQISAGLPQARMGLAFIPSAAA